MRQRILVHFFEMPVPMINVDVIGRLPDLVAKYHYVFHKHCVSYS